MLVKGDFLYISMVIKKKKMDIFIGTIVCYGSFIITIQVKLRQC